jgi:hypothetical protein
MGYEASLPPMAPQHGVTVVHAPGSFYGCLDTDDPVADVLCDSAPRSLVVLVIVTSPLMLDCQGTHALMRGTWVDDATLPEVSGPQVLTSPLLYHSWAY